MAEQPTTQPKSSINTKHSKARHTPDWVLPYSIYTCLKVRRRSYMLSWHSTTRSGVYQHQPWIRWSEKKRIRCHQKSASFVSNLPCISSHHLQGCMSSGCFSGYGTHSRASANETLQEFGVAIFSPARSQLLHGTAPNNRHREKLSDKNLSFVLASRKIKRAIVSQWSVLCTSSTPQSSLLLALMPSEYIYIIGRPIVLESTIRPDSFLILGTGSRV